MGRVCISHQPHPHARPGPHGHWQILTSYIRGLLHCTLDEEKRDVYMCVIPFHSTQVYCLGTILSMQISFVGFQPVQSSEHMAVWGYGGMGGYECMGVWGYGGMSAHKPACHHLQLVGGV